ncbi:YopX family protein [Cytobacillus solani]|uniref:YopX family protein n=1 Tax=Cytobacillus solani TaxID=1637975 RepID=UPI00207AF6BE|nr:YopX family protein [Cytobacillus solani]USK56549.1 YopX family protein [Cytobacillus solani]
MREIKFRAWDLDAQDRMYSWDEIKLHFSEHVEHEKVVVMQYTGLKDKNDKEIYEGDILNFVEFDTTGGHRDDREFTGIVKWKNGMFEIWNKPDSEFYGADGGFVLQYIWLQDDEIEVIGNIYENPELLNIK